MTTFAKAAPRSTGEETRQSLPEEAPSFVWKKFADGVCLRMRLFVPEGHSDRAFAPAVMFFFGGMWSTEYVDEFVPWAVHLSHRGIVCLLPEYRTRGRFDVTADDIVQDGLDAWRWMNENAAALGIDRASMTLAGADAGALLALVPAMQPAVRVRKWWQWWVHDEFPPMPAAVAIFRGIVDLLAPEARLLNAAQESVDVHRINPCSLLRRGLPPLFCAHGMLDPLLDYEMREWFCEEWEKAGNVARAVMCPNADHTITHFEVNPAVFEHVLIAWQSFMVEQGIWPETALEAAALMQ